MIVRSTPRFVVAVVITLVGVAAAVILGLAEIALVAAPWFVLLLLGLSRGMPQVPSLAVSSSHERVMAGDTVDITATLSSTQAATVTLIPKLRRANRGDKRTSSTAAEASMHALSPDELCTVPRRVRFDAWGTWSLDGHEVTVMQRYGLFVGHGSEATSLSVRVHPETEQLQRLVTPRFTRRTTGRHTARASGAGVEFADIRPFTSGDEVRSINWRATARAGSLQVTQQHPDRTTDVILFLDSFVESGHDIERVLTLTLNAASALAGGHLGFSDRVGLVQFGGVVHWLAPGAGRLQLHRITDFLLTSVTFSNQADKPLPMLAPSVWPPRSTVVAISSLLDDRFTNALSEVRRRGHDVSLLQIESLDDQSLGRQTDVQALSTRITRAERSLMRRELADQGIGVVVWQRDEPVEVPLTALGELRRRMRVQQR